MCGSKIPPKLQSLLPGQEEDLVSQVARRREAALQHQLTHRFPYDGTVSGDAHANSALSDRSLPL